VVEVVPVVVGVVEVVPVVVGVVEDVPVVVGLVEDVLVAMPEDVAELARAAERTKPPPPRAITNRTSPRLVGQKRPPVRPVRVIDRPPLQRSCR
jgi:hypothetical protein